MTNSRRHQSVIAYFCAEFAVVPQLPMYSGGLGVLAGDVLKEAADQKLPFVGVGLFYHHGYFRQIITPTGEQTEAEDIINPDLLLTPVTKNNRQIIVTIPLLDRLLKVKVWKFQVDSVPLYFLDTNISENIAEDRAITQHLYVTEQEMRLKQEIVLGIGGERALLAMNIHPAIYHLNEGHSAFSVLEITHHVMREKGLSFTEAFAQVHQRLVFTNHTLVAAGNDVFPKQLVARYLKSYVNQLGLPMEEVLAMGTVGDESSKFGVTSLALTMSCRINAVSQIHARLARKLWPKRKLIGITNGVHLPTWVSDEFKQLMPNFSENELDNLSDHHLWQLHQNAKQRLLDLVHELTGITFYRDIATIVWARRFTSYKRPQLLFSEIASLEKLTQSAHGALQIVIAGKAHPQDAAGKKAIHYINSTIKSLNLTGWVVFLPNYSLELALPLTRGADVWLNTPLLGHEASGTSGMKSGANGVLQCSTRDGWIAEIPLDHIGWPLTEKDTATCLYETIEDEVLPLYYTKSGNSFSAEWVRKMRQTMLLVWTKYSATRLLNDYLKLLYAPIWHQ